MHGIVLLRVLIVRHGCYFMRAHAAPNAPCLTILVEIFVNEKIDLSTDKDTQKTIIESVTEAINTCIIQKQKNPAAVRYKTLLLDY